MKRSMTCALLLAFLMAAPGAWADPMDDLIQSLKREYESLVPAPNSSVGTDYPTRQAALGSFYTARSMGLIYQLNQEMLNRQDQLADKYDEIIAQNREMIRLLRIISEGMEARGSVPPTAPGSDNASE